MDTLNARPRLLKQANLSLIRKLLRMKGTATRAEIATDTGISSTTVRSLLNEMMQNGEIKSIGYDESSGGRKAERYTLNPDRYYGAAFCLNGGQMHGLLVNICGEIQEIREVETAEEEMEAVITSILDDWMKDKEIRAIGIGVPGVVEDGGYQRKNELDGELYRVDIGDRLSRKYEISVVLENDLKAVVIGAARCYEKEYPCENPEDTYMAFLNFEKGCVSAGFIAGGRVIRGSGNFAGELGLMPMEDGRLLDEWLSEPMDDALYTDRIIRIIGWICGILNPQYVVLGGPDLRRECVGSIGEGLSVLLPRHMSTEIMYSPDIWQDYHEGMAYLTAGKIFDEIQLVKEPECFV